MNEIAPGIFHWKAFHENIRADVSSYFLAESGTLLDPMEPAEGLDWFDDRAPQRIVLTNRHHYRHSDRYRERFDIPVMCNEAGLHEFEGGPQVDGFSIGDELAPGVTAREFDAISPDDTALHIASAPGFLAFADGIVNYRKLSFVSDNLMDEPEQVKSGVRTYVGELLELDFDGLLFAHGEPIVGGGKEALRAFAGKD
jgi:hypothetical protein